MSTHLTRSGVNKVLTGKEAAERSHPSKVIGVAQYTLIQLRTALPVLSRIDHWILNCRVNISMTAGRRM